MNWKWLLIIFFLINFISCNTVEPPVSPPIGDNKPKTGNSIKLTVDYSTLTSVNLKITKSISDTLNSSKYKLKRNESVISEFPLYASDTTYLDDNNGIGFEQGTLLNYKVEAYKDTSTIPADTSNILSAEVLRTTSNDIIWQVDTISSGSNSFLNDVWGLDENNIWAVGHVYLNGVETMVINWDGQKWNALPIFEGTVNAIWGFSPFDIWVGGFATNRGFVAHWNGIEWMMYRSDGYFANKRYEIFQINAIWGNSSNDVWAVGAEGTIIRWNGTEWFKVQSPLSGVLTDIWGTSANSIYINQRSGPVQGQVAKIAKYNGSSWEVMATDLPSELQDMSSFWIDKSGKGYIVGNSTFYYDGSTFKKIDIEVGQLSFFNSVRGTGVNDIFISGEDGFIYHYNGDKWNHYSFRFNYLDWMSVKGFMLFRNKFVFAANSLNKGLIITGKRN